MAGIRLNPVARHWRTIFLHLSVITARLMPGDVTKLPRFVNVARGDRLLGNTWWDGDTFQFDFGTGEYLVNEYVELI